MIQNKKNVGIVTWYEPSNYGTGLQAFALKKYFEILGYNVFFIDDRRINVFNTKENKLKKLASKIWWKKQQYRFDNKTRNQMQNIFISEYCQVEHLITNEDIDRLNNNTDVFVSGGDQIWNPFVTKPYLMLDFVNSNKPKISYGTSVGVKEIPTEYLELYKKYLSSYKYISVREKQSVDALMKCITNKITEVVDPTFLLSNIEWNDLMNNAKLDKSSFNEPFIFCYFVGERHSYWDYVEKIRKSTGYRVIVVPINDEGYNNKYKKYVKVSPAEFLWLLKKASIVCTDSFHATVFSLQFGKEFYVLKRFIDSEKSSQNGRIYNLLDLYGIRDRIVEDESLFSYSSKIDYKEVWNKIEEDRQRSREWLKKTIADL